MTYIKHDNIWIQYRELFTVIFIILSILLTGSPCLTKSQASYFFFFNFSSLRKKEKQSSSLCWINDIYLFYFTLGTNNAVFCLLLEIQNKHILKHECALKTRLTIYSTYKLFSFLKKARAVNKKLPLSI